MQKILEALRSRKRSNPYFQQYNPDAINQYSPGKMQEEGKPTNYHNAQFVPQQVQHHNLYPQLPWNLENGSKPSFYFQGQSPQNNGMAAFNPTHIPTMWNQQGYNGPGWNQPNHGLESNYSNMYSTPNLFQDLPQETIEVSSHNEQPKEIAFNTNPLFPPYPMSQMEWQQSMKNPRPPMSPHPTNPYPSSSKSMKQNKNIQQGGVSNFLTHFKGTDGSYDVPKMVNTAGAMVNTVNQISSIVKSVGSMFIGGIK